MCCPRCIYDLSRVRCDSRRVELVRNDEKPHEGDGAELEIRFGCQIVLAFCLAMCSGLVVGECVVAVGRSFIGG
jgi:hypothetical protein